MTTESIGIHGVALCEPLEGRRLLSAGDIDMSFGRQGVVHSDLPGSSAIGQVEVQRDGKIVAVGIARKRVDRSDLVLLRYNADGTLDRRFGERGKVIMDVRGDDAFGRLLLLRDGRIVVAGTSDRSNNGRFTLLRFTVAGKLDTSFGEGGMVFTSFPASDASHTADASLADVALQEDGKIVAAGTVDNAFAIARYNADGSLDRTFSLDGAHTFSVGGFDESCNTVAVQRNGKIVVGGEKDDDIVLARVNPSGSPDRRFGYKGKTVTRIGEGSSISDLIILGNGKIVAAGQTGSRSDLFSGVDFALLRYNADGTLDTSFGRRGRVITDMGANTDQVVSLGIVGDRILLSGGSMVIEGFFDVQSADIAVAAFLPTGRLDRSFGHGGRVITDVDVFDVGVSLAALSDERLLVAGVSGDGIGATDVVLVAYEL